MTTSQTALLNGTAARLQECIDSLEQEDTDRWSPAATDCLTNIRAAIGVVTRPGPDNAICAGAQQLLDNVTALEKEVDVAWSPEARSTLRRLRSYMSMFNIDALAQGADDLAVAEYLAATDRLAAAKADLEAAARRAYPPGTQVISAQRHGVFVDGVVASVYPAGSPDVGCITVRNSRTGKTHRAYPTMSVDGKPAVRVLFRPDSND